MDQGHQLQQALQTRIENGELAGAAAAVWRDSRIQRVCVGWRDIESALPIDRDTIFRIASMTKPITSVAALLLVDEGVIALNDAISEYAPEFSHMRALRSPDGPLEETDESVRPITFDDLLTHRAGFTYADFHRGSIARAYRECTRRRY